MNQWGLSLVICEESFEKTFFLTTTVLFIHSQSIVWRSNTYKFYFCKWFPTSTKSLKEIVKPNLFFREQSIFENVYPALIVFPCHPCDVSKYIIVNYASTYVVNSEIIKAAMKNPIEYAFVTGWSRVSPLSSTVQTDLYAMPFTQNIYKFHRIPLVSAPSDQMQTKNLFLQ